MNAKTKFPLYLPGRECKSNRNSCITVADLRPCRSTFAVYVYENGEISQKLEKSYETEQFSSVSDLILQFIKDTEITDFFRLCLAVPGPVIDGKCQTTNLPWTIDSKEVKQKTKFQNIYLINDLEATAYSLADVYDHFFETIHAPKNKINGNVAILAPGNGLGEAGLYYDGKYLRPFATEGGHTEFSPRNDFEVDFYQFLNKIYGIVTWEKTLSKSGIYNIYRFLRDVGRHSESPDLFSKIQESDCLTALEEIEKSKKNRLASLTITMFFEFLAREANNLVLKLKATGGLIITGEILDKLSHLMDKNKFYKDFLISDRMENLLKDTPIYILRHEKSILEGAANYGAFIEMGDLEVRD